MVKKSLLLAALLLILNPASVGASVRGAGASELQQESEQQTQDAQQDRDQQKIVRIEAQKAQAEAQKGALDAQKKAIEEQKKAMEVVRKRIYLLESRPRLGLVLRTEADEKQDARGATVEAVTPGGPAEEAGIKAGDVITKFNGVSLAGPFKGAGDEESGPAARLVDLAGKMKEGDKVVLDILRGSEAKSLTVTPRVLGPRAHRFYGDHGEMEYFEAPEPPDLPDVDEMLRHVPDINKWAWIGRSAEWLDMEMAPMNPELGAYFGTSEGILVIQAPKESPLKLRGGDVILKIGDRQPKSPSQVMRILGSYEPGETVNIQVLRKQKRESLSFKVPERRMEWNRQSDGPAPPTPPAPPAPPKPAVGDPPQGAIGGRA